MNRWLDVGPVVYQGIPFFEIPDPEPFFFEPSSVSDISDIVYQPELWYEEWYPPLSPEEGRQMIVDVIMTFVRKNVIADRRSPLCRAIDYFFGGEHARRSILPRYLVGWSQPPRPIEVVPSFDPSASKRDQARAVLLDYYHDDNLRYWSDNEAVKRCFIKGKDPRKENHDPLLLIAAYENPKHPVWNCHGDKMTWKDLDDAVQQAIAHRKKLGPLPKSTYDTNPAVIYYYDNDKMKKIQYPNWALVDALNPSSDSWWKGDWGKLAPQFQSDDGKKAGLDDIHIFESDDAQKINAERKKSGQGRTDQGGVGGGNWGSEGFAADKDFPGAAAGIVSALLAVAQAVLDVAGVFTFGATTAAGIALGLATPAIIAAVQALDAGLHAGDFGAALHALGPALAQAAVAMAAKGAGASGIQIPPQAMQALGTTVTAIGQAVADATKKKSDIKFGQLWTEVSKQAGSFSKIGNDEAEAIAQFLGGQDQTGVTKKVFLSGYEAGKLSDPPTIAAIANILTSMVRFSDPKIINLWLLGAGIGYVSKVQEVGGAAVTASSAKHQSTQTRGYFASGWAQADLEFFCGALLDRYGAQEFAGLDLSCPPGFHPVGSGLACSYEGHASCLAGTYDQLGRFVCTDSDVPCPMGMMTRPGSPSNWCFPSGASLGAVRTGQAAEPDWSFPALGCPHGYWKDPITSECHPVVSPYVPLTPRQATRTGQAGGGQQGVSDLEIARRAAQAAWHGFLDMPGAFQMGYHFGKEYLL